MTNINWNILQASEHLEDAAKKSYTTPVLFYKHSTRCAISSVVLSRLERSWNENEIPQVEAYFLDLIAFRDISNAIAHNFQVTHESPQVLVVVEGRCVFHTSHLGINFKAIKEAINHVQAL